MDQNRPDPILQYIVNNPEAFADNLAKVIEQGGKAIAAYLEPIEKGETTPSYGDEINDWVKTLSHVGQYWLSDPNRAMEAQTRLWAGYMSIWSSTLQKMAGEKADPAIEPDPKDKRFKDPEWSENQFFDFLKQVYLVTTRWAEDLVEEAEDIDEHTRHKAEFYVRQLANAMSPSNFIFTNPELLRATATSNGENLVRGMKMLAEDIERGGGKLRIRQTALKGFEVGETLATTPGKVIAQNEVRQLIQYSPTTETVKKKPVLVVPPWINKFYILDLTPEKSFIKWMVDEGYTVFVVSWVNPDANLAEKTFEDYMREGVIESFDLVQKATGEDKIDVIGYCVGGTLTAMTLAYMAETGDHRADTVTFLATQVDFKHAGDLKVFVDPEQLLSLEAHMREKGYLEGERMAAAFNLLRSNDLIWPYVVNNYVKGQEPFPFDLLYWNSDSTRMPAANHSFYLRNFYLENRLTEGTLTVGNHRISLGDVTIPVYNLATREDHIAPARSVFEGSRFFGGEVRYTLAGSGHIAGVVNPPSKNKYQFWSDAPVEGDYDDWLTRATEHAGSWWPDWRDWMQAHAKGEEVKARKPGGGKLKPIEDAPGSYVKVKS
ncbi:class I poly(R)-hydroxyalkanoic acid synthase [Amorphus orientalis]|uniref:Polyhydroxyalkanoate synthase n=1 Tax=Amorphus orientalis TaxID=649198 RepID=A0AAE4ATC2_9HYPH|nr:class I poly(R)-hydroxyalkanoic acid synthase [Amorphus orientalis]MDQ0316017.1 polyhydroxyalkanoate synthase [Amorphus orientalis]